MRLHGRAVADQILARDDDRLRAGQPLGDFDPVLRSAADLHRDLIGLAVPDDVHVLEVLQAGQGIDRNLDRIRVRADHHFNAGEHAAFERVVGVREIHLHGHGAGGSIEGLHNPRDLPDKDTVRVGLRPDLGYLADRDQRDVFLDHLDQGPHDLNLVQRENAS